MSIINYRPISLTSTSRKLLEHIITKQITEFLNTNDELKPSVRI